MRGDPCLQAIEEVVEPQREEIRLIDPRGAHFRSLTDAFGFVVRRQPDPGLAHPPNALVASGAAEDEVDRRKHALPLEDLHDLLAPGRVDAVMAADRHTTPTDLGRWIRTSSQTAPRYGSWR